MRRVGGLLLMVIIACAALLGTVASGGAAELPGYDGIMTFQQIQGPEDPEEYSWQVKLQPGQELVQFDDQHAVGFYEEGQPAFGISAEKAHDRDGTNVPTTLTVTQPDIITLTVLHREGNPLAGGAPFDYPIIGGAGWEGGFRTQSASIGEEAKPPPPAPAAVTTPPPAPPERVFVTRALGADELYIRPHSFLLSADGTFGVARVHWNSYGGAVATARGRGFTNDCIPDCAAGRFLHPQAKLRLSRVVTCQGRSVYARLHYALVGPLPKDFPRQGGIPMLPLGEDGKPDC